MSLAPAVSVAHGVGFPFCCGFAEQTGVVQAGPGSTCWIADFPRGSPCSVMVCPPASPPPQLLSVPLPVCPNDRPIYVGTDHGRYIFYYDPAEDTGKNIYPRPSAISLVCAEEGRAKPRRECREQARLLCPCVRLHARCHTTSVSVSYHVYHVWLGVCGARPGEGVGAPDVLHSAKKCKLFKKKFTFKFWVHKTQIMQLHTPLQAPYPCISLCRQARASSDRQRQMHGADMRLPRCEASGSGPGAGPPAPPAGACRPTSAAAATPCGCPCRTRCATRTAPA